MQRERAVFNGHDARNVLNLIVTLDFITGRSNSIVPEFKAGFAAQRIGDQAFVFAFRQAFNHRRQRLVLFRHIVLAGLVFRGNCHRTIVNRQCTVYIPHIVVSQCFSTGNSDGVIVDLCSLRTVQAQPQRIADRGLVIFVGQARQCCGQIRICIAVDLALVIRSHDQGRLGDRQLAGFILDNVVALCRITRRRDCIGSNVLPCFTSELVCYRIFTQQACYGRGIRGIFCSVFLGLVIRLDDNLFRLNGHLAGHIRHSKVLLCRITARRNGISADVLIVFTVDCNRQCLPDVLVRNRKASGRRSRFDCPGLFRFRISEGLLQIVRCYDNGHRIDRQLARYQRNAELISYVIFVSILHYCSAGDVHRVFACINSGHACAQAAHSVGVAVHGKGGLHYAGNRLLCSIVSGFIALTCHCDLIQGVTALDIQCTVYSTNFIIVSIGAFVQRVGEGIRGAANYRLAAGYAVGSAFAFREVSAGHFVVGQRAAVIFLLGTAGSQRHRALVNCQCTGFECNAVIALILFAFCRNGVSSGINQAVSIVVVAQVIAYDRLRITILQAGYSRLQAGISRTVVGLAGIIRLHSQRCLRDGEGCRLIGHSIVALFIFSAGSDCIGAGIGTGRAAQRIGDQFFTFAFNQAADFSFQFGIRVSVGLAIILHRYGHSLRIHREGAGLIGYSIVALFCSATGGNGIVTHGFAACTGHIVAYRISTQQAFHSRAQFRIARAIDLVRVIRGYSHRLRINRECAAGCRNGIVRVLAQYDSNRITALILAFSALQGVLQLIANHTGFSRLQFRFVSAEHFAVGNRGNGRFRLVDGQLRRLINHCIVGQRFRAGYSDIIGAGILTGLAAEAQTQRFTDRILIIAVSQTVHCRSQFIVFRAIGLGLRNRGHGQFNLVDGQFAGYEGYSIVALFSIAVRCNDIVVSRIITDCAAEGIADCIVSDCSFNCRIILRFGRTVILGLVVCCYGNRRAIDLQQAGFCAHSKLFGHIIAIFIGYRRGTGYVHRVFAGVRSAGFSTQAAYRIGMTFHCEGVIHQSADALLG